jgi:hypothetical protein
MYWKVKQIESTGEEYFIYKYFRLRSLPAVSGSYYNPVTREIVHPIKQELVVEDRICHDESEFIVWYQANIKLKA